MARNSIILSLALGAALWTADALMDSLVFHSQSFPDAFLLNLTPHQFYTRLIIVASICAVGYILARMVLKRNRAMLAFQESNDVLLTITNSAKDAIVLLDDEGKISFWNGSAEKIFGYASHEVIGRELHTLLAPHRFQRPYQESFLKFRRSGQGSTAGSTLELQAIHKGGTEFPVEISLTALQLKGKWHAVGLLRDITDRKRTEEELQKHREQLEQLVTERTEELHAVNEILRKEIHDRSRTEEELSRSEQFLNTIFDSIHDPFSIVNRDYQIIKFNDAYARMRGRRAGDLYGKKCHAVLHNRPVVCDECVVNRTLLSKDPCAKEKQLMLPDGTIAWVEIFTYPILDAAGQVSHVIEYTRDITDRKKDEEEKKQLIDRLNHLSTTDSLTGLLNRRALNDMLGHEIERATRYCTDLSLVLCDIDRFKKINDIYGHTAGDRALLSVAAVLQRSLRRSDIVGRYGGDEFMMVLPETSLAGAHQLADKVRQTVEQMDLEFPGNERARITLSMGVASCCSSVENIDTLVALADTALYSAKEAGRNQVSTMKR